MWDPWTGMKKWAWSPTNGPKIIYNWSTDKGKICLLYWSVTCSIRDTAGLDQSPRIFASSKGTWWYSCFLFHFYLICWFFSITGLLSIWFGFQFNTYGDSLSLFCLLAILWKSMRENINSGRRWRWSWKSWRMGNQDKMHLWKILKHKVNYNKKKTLDSKLEQLKWWFEVKISPLLPTYTEFSNEKSEKVFIWEWNESFVWGRWGKVS